MSNTSPNMTLEQYTEILIAEFLKTDDFKRVTNAFTHELLKKWAGQSGLKKRLAPSIEKRMKKSLFGAENGGAATAALPASADSTALAAPIIALFNDMLAKVGQMGDTLDDMPYEKKEALLETIIQNIDFRKIGALSGPVTRMMTAVYEKNPTFLSDHLKDGLTDWINSLDFTTLTENLTRRRKTSPDPRKTSPPWPARPTTRSGRIRTGCCERLKLFRPPSTSPINIWRSFSPGSVS